MNDDKPKGIWKRAWRSRWLIFLVPGATLFITLIILLVIDGGRIKQDWATVIGVTGCSVAGVLLLLFIRWLCNWKHFCRFLFVCACLATLIALFYAEEDWRGKHDWEKFKRQWEAKGEKFAFKDFVPPPVPDDKNFAFSPVWIAGERYNFQNELKRAEAWYGNRIYDADVTKILPFLPVSVSALVGTNWAYHSPPTPEISGNWAVARMTDLKPWQSYYRNLEETNPTAEIPIAPQAQSPARDVLLALSKFNPVIEQLRTDSTRPYSRFPLEYDDENKAAILLPHLAELKRYAQVLQLRAIAELQNGQNDKALDDVGLALRLTEAIRTEPILISHLVRIAMVNLTLQPIYEGLVEHKWSGAQLAELNSELAELNFGTDFKLTMHGEIGFQDAIVRYLRQHPSQYPILMGYTGNYEDKSAADSIVTAAMVFHLVPSGWFYQNQLQCARVMEEFFLPIVDTNKEQTIFSPAIASRATAYVENGRRHPTPYNILESSMLPSPGYAARKFAYGQESVDLARVAIALERFRLARGEYPESLDELAPQFIPKLPHDIINGQPLHYHRTSDGQFVLYSVGWNEADDGGTVAFYQGSSEHVDISKGDWVWRYPAK